MTLCKFFSFDIVCSLRIKVIFIYLWTKDFFSFGKREFLRPWWNVRVLVLFEWNKVLGLLSPSLSSILGCSPPAWVLVLNTWLYTGHGWRIIKKQNPQCRLYWCLILSRRPMEAAWIEFIDWRYSQSCWYFRHLLWTVALLPSLWPPPTPPPSQSKHTVYTYMCGCGMVVLSCGVDHILQEFNTLFLKRFITYKIDSPPQTKTPVMTTFRDWCLYSSLVHDAGDNCSPVSTTPAITENRCQQHRQSLKIAGVVDIVNSLSPVLIFICEYLLEFSKKLITVLLGYSGA